MRRAKITRREFVGGLAAIGLLEAGRPWAAEPAAPLPLVDYHVHCDKPMTLRKLAEISRQRGVKFGIVEHAGTKDNQYPRVLSSDEDLNAYLAELEGTPFYRGIQAEYNNWMDCFSKPVLARLDYVLTDAMTFPDQRGRPVRLWDGKLAIDDPQAFMDRYAEYHVEKISREPIDILANPTYLPPAIAAQYDALWTPRRMRKIIDAALEHRVALEINAGSRLPRPAFLKMAKEAGATFSFGSNIRGPNVGKLDYCLEMVQALGLTRQDIFTPAPPGQKPVQRRPPPR